MIINEGFLAPWRNRFGFWTEFLSPSEIADGKDPSDYGELVIDPADMPHGAVLRAFRQNVRGVYLSTPLIPWGHTSSCETTRIEGNGGHTEFERGKHEFSPLWHFGWTDDALFYLRGIPGRLEPLQSVALTPGSRLRFEVQELERTVKARVTETVHGISRVIIDQEDEMDWALWAPHTHDLKYNFVTTANAETTRERPVAQQIRYLSIKPTFPSAPVKRSWYRRLWEWLIRRFRGIPA